VNTRPDEAKKSTGQTCDAVRSSVACMSNDADLREQI